MQDIFKNKDKREGDSVTDLMEEVLRLLTTFTEINQRIDGIGLGARDKNK